MKTQASILLLSLYALCACEVNSGGDSLGSITPPSDPIIPPALGSWSNIEEHNITQFYGRSFAFSSSFAVSTERDTSGHNLWECNSVQPYNCSQVSNSILSFNVVVRGMTSDHLGNIYIFGRVLNGSTSSFAVYKSADSGMTWTNVDPFMMSGSTQNEAFAITVSPNGILYVAGTSNSPLGELIWVVRKSTDNGTTWTTSDAYTYSSMGLATANRPKSILADSAGRVFVAGTTESDENERWIVRRSVNQGLNWETVDDFVYPAGQVVTENSPTSIAQAPDGSIYVVGYAYLANPGKYRIVIRRSIQGNEWTFIHDNNLNHPQTTPTVAGFSSDGNLFIAARLWKSNSWSSFVYGYDPAQNFLWMEDSLPYDMSYVSDLKTDPVSGRVAIAAQVKNSDTNQLRSILRIRNP